MIEHGHATHTGLQRAHNEDSYWADSERGVWLVADGMGGPARGEAASATALDATVTALDAGIPLADAFRRAGAAILAHPGQRSGAAPMGSTLAALKLDAGGFAAARIGDSRIYVWHDGKLVRLPHAQAAIDAEVASAEQSSAPSRNRATQALGIPPTRRSWTRWPSRRRSIRARRTRWTRSASASASTTAIARCTVRCSTRTCSPTSGWR
jgi:protein phosphatase